MRVPYNGRCLRENPMNMYDLKRVPHLWKPLYHGIQWDKMDVCGYKMGISWSMLDQLISHDMFQ